MSVLIMTLNNLMLRLNSFLQYFKETFVCVCVCVCVKDIYLSIYLSGLWKPNHINIEVSQYR